VRSNHDEDAAKLPPPDPLTPPTANNDDDVAPLPPLLTFPRTWILHFGGTCPFEVEGRLLSQGPGDDDLPPTPTANSDVDAADLPPPLDLPRPWNLPLWRNWARCCQQARATTNSPIASAATRVFFCFWLRCLLALDPGV
jgi:hypothetical protein